MQTDFLFRNESTEAELDVLVTLSIFEVSYGEDADGNRGKVGLSFEIKDFKIYNGQIDVTKLVGQINPELFEEIEQEIEEKSLEHVRDM